MIYLILTLLFCILSILPFSNPLVNVLMLIFAFINSSLLISTFKFYFLSFLIVFIYIGAISILFIFTLMIINFKLILRYQNIFVKITSFLIFYIIYYILNFFFIFFSKNFIILDLNFLFLKYLNNFFFYQLFIMPDIFSIGMLIFNYFYINFVIIFITMLSVLISSISLVIKRNIISKKQQSYIQICNNLNKNLNGR